MDCCLRCYSRQSWQQLLLLLNPFCQTIPVTGAVAAAAATTSATTDTAVTALRGCMSGLAWPAWHIEMVVCLLEVAQLVVAAVPGLILLQ